MVFLSYLSNTNVEWMELNVSWNAKLFSIYGVHSVWPLNADGRSDAPKYHNFNHHLNWFLHWMDVNSLWKHEICVINFNSNWNNISRNGKKKKEKMRHGFWLQMKFISAMIPWFSISKKRRPFVIMFLILPRPWSRSRKVVPFILLQ